MEKNKLKITKGEYELRYNEYGHITSLRQVGGRKIAVSRVNDIDESNANLSIFAECLEITNQCGYSPKQLLGQRNELKDALDILIHLHSCEQEGLSSGMPSAMQWIKAVDNAQEVINKIEL